MAHEIPVWLTSLEVSTDLSAYKYRAVKVDSNGQVALAGAGENALGILLNECGDTQGKIVPIQILGEAKAVYGGAVTAGDNLASDALGRLVTATGSDAVIGIARESGVLNDIRTVFLLTRTSSGVNTKSVLSIPVKLANLVTGDVMTTYIPGYAGVITKVAVAVTDPTTDVDADATINLEIGTTNLTGGVVTIDDANMATLGAVVDGTAVTANNIFTGTDSISIEAVVTNAFSDGEIVVLVTLG